MNFSGTPNTDNSDDFAAGVVAGLGLSAVLVGFYRIFQWLLSLGTVKNIWISFHSWATTPAVAPVDLLNLLPLVVIGLIAWAMLGMMVRF